MSYYKGNIAWVDCETTGLDPQSAKLLEIGVIVTDANLNVLDEKGFHAIVYYTPSEVADLRYQADTYVNDMHEKTGLWGKLSTNDASYLFMVDRDLHRYLYKFGQPKTMPVGGNSVRLDMNFMDEYLPMSAQHLDYHMRDVSSIAGFANDWLHLPWFEKVSDHTAMTDIREAIREAKHYRETVFRSRDELEVHSKGAAFHARAIIAEQELAELREKVSETVELTPEQASPLLLARRYHLGLLRATNEKNPFPTPVKAKSQRDARNAYLRKAVALGVPQAQADRFVKGA